MKYLEIEIPQVQACLNVQTSTRPNILGPQTIKVMTPTKEVPILYAT